MQENRLKAVRLKQELSRVALARALAVSESTIYRWEKNKSRMSVTALMRTAAVLQVLPTDILPALHGACPAAEEVPHAT